MVSVGLVISLWAGSSAMSAFVESITIAYGQHEVRHPVAERFFALGLYLVALLAGIIMLPLLAIGPDYLPKLFPESWRGRGRRHRQPRLLPGARARPDLHADRALQGRAQAQTSLVPRGARARCWPPPSSSWPASGCGCTCRTSTAHGLTYGALATPITFLLFYYFVVDGDHHRRAVQQRDAGVLPAQLSKRELRKWRRYDPERDRADRSGRRRLTRRADQRQPFFIDS